MVLNSVAGIHSFQLKHRLHAKLISVLLTESERSQAVVRAAHSGPSAVGGHCERAEHRVGASRRPVGVLERSAIHPCPGLAIVMQSDRVEEVIVLHFGET